MPITVTSRGISSRDVYAKPPVTLPVPIRDALDAGENLVLGLRQGLLSIGDGDGVLTGVANEHIILQWQGRTAMIRASELFVAWVQTFDPDSAKRMTL